MSHRRPSYYLRAGGDGKEEIMEARAETAVGAVGGSYGMLARSFQRALLAENKSPAAVRMRPEAARQCGAYLVAQGMPTAVGHITREHVESYPAAVLARCKPATALTR